MDRKRPTRSGLRSREFTLLIVATAASFSGFVLLLPLVPLWATRGGAGEFGAGATTAAFMLTTVLTQLAMPWLLDHGGYRWTFAAGALLLAVPTPLLLLSTAVVPLVVVSAARGIGFGMVTVVGAALAARLVQPADLGRAAGYYGIAVGVPNLLFLSLGVWFALNIGYAPVFWAATVIPLLGFAAALGLWRAGDAVRSSVQESGAHASSTGAGASTSAPRLWLALAAPLLIMLVLALASSAVITFLAIPLREATWAATVALLGYGAMTVLGRWLAGTLSDRYGRLAALVPGTVAAGLGITLAGWALWPASTGWAGPSVAAAVLIILGATLFGAGFGGVQNDTMVAMFRRSGPQAYGTASAAWNIGFDAGTGAGALALGIIAQTLGYGPAFAVSAVAIAGCVPVAVRLSRR